MRLGISGFMRRWIWTCDICEGGGARRAVGVSARPAMLGARDGRQTHGQALLGEALEQRHVEAVQERAAARVVDRQLVLGRWPVGQGNRASAALPIEGRQAEEAHLSCCGSPMRIRCSTEPVRLARMCGSSVWPAQSKGNGRASVRRLTGRECAHARRLTGLLDEHDLGRDALSDTAGGSVSQ